jgi:hypothetical protein
MIDDRGSTKFVKEFMQRSIHQWLNVDDQGSMKFMGKVWFVIKMVDDRGSWKSVRKFDLPKKYP